MFRALLSLAIAATACGGSPADTTDSRESQTHAATVIEVFDGDSVLATIEGVEAEIRLLGINAPERDECWADEARSALVDALEGEVVVVAAGRDQYGRSLAHLYAQGSHVNLAMVEAGAAIALGTEDSALVSAEDRAYAGGLGMWSGEACGPPAAGGVEIDELVFDAPGPDAENPNAEFVIVVNTHDDADLTGWAVRDESSTHRFRFPDGFVLGAGDRVVIRSGCGENRPDELFWCADGPVWNNDGDMALLLDAYGNVVDRWRYEG